MPAFSFIFNRLQVVIPSKKLSLSVESSASLQDSRGNPQPMKIRQVLDLFCSGKVWVVPGNACRIDFSFTLDGQKDEEPFMENVLKHFAAYVRDVPLWSEVSLNAELELPERGSSDHLQCSFSVILKHAPLRGTSGHSSTPLLFAPPDVQVPTGVPCFRLRRIKIIMSFISERTDQNPRSPLPVVAEGAAESFARRTSCLYPIALLHQDHEMLDDVALLRRMDIDIPLLTTPSLTKSFSALHSPPNSQEKEMEGSPADCGIDSIMSDLTCVREMAQLALRKLVGGRQKKSPPGMKVVSRRPTLTLSKLAPSLFSPGFLEAMSQRSKFIPTISHALSVSLLRNAQSPGLRRKLLSLVSNPAQPCNSNALMDPVNGMNDRPDHLGHPESWDVSRAVEERLWAMMQRSLSHSSSVPYAVPSENEDTRMDTGSAVGLYEMLTGGPEETEHVMDESLLFADHDRGFLEDNFEDLFQDMPDEEEYERCENLFSDSMNDRSADVDFEDLLEYEKPAGPDETARAKLDEYDMNFDILPDRSDTYWEYTQNIHTGDPLNGYSTENDDILDIENEDMLI